MKRVHQKHWDGCFVACVAMLKNTTYDKATELVHQIKLDRHTPACLPPENVPDILKRCKVQFAQRSDRRRISSFKNPTLFLIRWSGAPELLHAVVWDPSQRKILDPHFIEPLTHAEYESQADSVFEILPRIKRKK